MDCSMYQKSINFTWYTICWFCLTFCTIGIFLSHCWLTMSFHDLSNLSIWTLRRCLFFETVTLATVFFSSLWLWTIFPRTFWVREFTRKARPIILLIIHVIEYIKRYSSSNLLSAIMWPTAPSCGRSGKHRIVHEYSRILFFRRDPLKIAIVQKVLWCGYQKVYFNHWSLLLY
jgi:hypothetical protein